MFTNWVSGCSWSSRILVQDILSPMRIKAMYGRFGNHLCKLHFTQRVVRLCRSELVQVRLNLLPVDYAVCPHLVDLFGGVAQLIEDWHGVLAL